MGRKNARYRREALVDMLQEEQKQSFDNLPAPSTFEFQEVDGMIALNVGTLRGSPIWVRLESTNNTWLIYQSDGGNLNKSANFSKKRLFVKLPFSLLSNGILIKPWSPEMRAFVQFVLVWCGKRDEFINFGHGHGLNALKDALLLILNKNKASQLEMQVRKKRRVNLDEELDDQKSLKTFAAEISSSSGKTGETAGETKQTFTDGPSVPSSNNKSKGLVEFKTRTETHANDPKKRSHDEFLEDS